MSRIFLLYIVLICVWLGGNSSAMAQITPAQERDAGIRNQQELQRQQQQEQQQRQQLERMPDVRLTGPEKAITQTLPIETPCFLIERLQLPNRQQLNHQRHPKQSGLQRHQRECERGHGQLTHARPRLEFDPDRRGHG